MMITDAKNIFYQVYPAESVGDRLPIIFLSGFGGDHSAWEKVIRLLPLNMLKVALDNQGVGRTDLRCEHLTTHDMALDVISVMDSLGIDKTLIAGHSMGGAIAQEVALIAPERVAGILLAASFAKLDTVASMALSSRVKLSETRIDTHLKIESTLPWLYGNTFLKDPDNITYAKNRILKNPFPQKIAGMKAQLAACINHNTTDRLVKINCAIMIMASKEDLLVTDSHSTFLKKCLPQAQHITLEDAGHMFIIENPTLVANAVRLFHKGLHAITTINNSIIQ